MSQQSSLTQSAHSVRQVLTAYSQPVRRRLPRPGMLALGRGFSLPATVPTNGRPCASRGGGMSLALLWQILSGTGFPNQFFCDSWVVGFGGADHGWKDVGLERRAWTLSQAVSGSVGSQGAATNVST